MKFSLRFLTTLVSVALCGIVYAAPAPLDETDAVDITARDFASDAMIADELVTRGRKRKSAAKAKAAPPKGKGKAAAPKVIDDKVKKGQAKRKAVVQKKKAANARVQRGAASKIDKKVNAFKKANSRSDPKKVDAKAEKLRRKEKARVTIQSQKKSKTARKEAWGAAAKNRQATTDRILAIQKAQGKKPERKAEKKRARDAVLKSGAKNINARTAKYKKRPDKDGQRRKEQNRELSQARKNRKAERANQWAAKKNTKAQKDVTKAAATARRQERRRTGASAPKNQPKQEKNVKPTKQLRQNVKDRFKGARDMYAKTLGMPARKQTATVGTTKATGREVRNAVFNSYVHRKKPIGDQKMPKVFDNSKYSADHPDPNLRGKRPLSEGGKAFKEFPVIPKSQSGWIGSGRVGAMRTITYKEGGEKRMSVIGHDPSRGGDGGDHYVAKITREMDDFE
ncbi:hypothetical protein MD484_g7477, partial [Candolleomyces efflorescens]